MCCNACRRAAAAAPAPARFDAFSAFETFDSWEEFDAALFDDTDAGDDGERFLRILRVLPTGRQLPNGATGLRVSGGRVDNNAARRQLNNTSAGVFLHGATQQRARNWAQQLAQRMGGTVVFDPPHRPGGRPHFHIEGPGGARTGHIFYGPQVPGGDFFARL